MNTTDYTRKDIDMKMVKVKRLVVIKTKAINILLR